MMINSFKYITFFHCIIIIFLCIADLSYFLSMKNVTGFLNKTSLKIIRVYCNFDHSRVNIVDSKVDLICLCLHRIRDLYS